MKPMRGIFMLLCFNLVIGSAVADVQPVDKMWNDYAGKLNSDKAWHELTQSEKPLRILARELSQDSKRIEWKSLWGSSINFDELAKGIIVQPAILKELAERFGVAYHEDSRIVHAGMEHTYGYLFSTLQTSFGFKRARWVQDDIEFGFGLPRGMLGPAPTEGTLFSNVTYFIGNIVYGQEAATSGELEEIKEGTVEIPKVLREYSFEKLQTARLKETVEVPGAVPRQVTLRSDFVTFPNIAAGRSNSALLIYSVQDSQEKVVHLITAFPVASSFVDQALAAQGLGPDKPIITRYNAYVSGVTGLDVPLKGLRERVFPRQ